MAEQKKALIAMSGGVDSTVAALLMQREGYACTGATMRLFRQEDLVPGQTCGSLRDVAEAQAVAARLGMEHYVFDFSAIFREQVMRHFAESYTRGRTPNPCIACNRHLKFDAMLQKAEALGFDCIATGHYARVEAQGSRFLLKKGLDEAKDQSYFLCALTQEQLRRIRFPLGAFRKSEIREIALHHGLSNAEKRDSQDICFVPDGDHGAFIEHFTGKTFPAGDFTDRDGNVLGQHRGIVRCTIGQRKGLGIALGYPAYVCGIDPAENRVVLGRNEDLFQRELTADEVNLIACDDLPSPVRICARIRSRHKEQPAVAWMEDGLLRVRFDVPQRAITPGQAVVLYDGDTVVGSGTIC